MQHCKLMPILNDMIILMELHDDRPGNTVVVMRKNNSSDEAVRLTKGDNVLKFHIVHDRFSVDTNIEDCGYTFRVMAAKFKLKLCHRTISDDIFKEEPHESAISSG